MWTRPFTLYEQRMMGGSFIYELWFGVLECTNQQDTSAPLGDSLERIRYSRPVSIVYVLLWLGWGYFSYLHLLYRGFLHCWTEELLGRGLSFFCLDGTLSFLILVSINEALGTRTLWFNFLYTILLYDFLVVQSVPMSSYCKCGVGRFAHYSGL